MNWIKAKPAFELGIPILGILIAVGTFILKDTNNKIEKVKENYRQFEQSQKLDAELSSFDEKLKRTYDRINSMFDRINYKFKDIAPDSIGRLAVMGITARTAVDVVETQMDNPVLKMNPVVSGRWYELHERLKHVTWMTDGYQNPHVLLVWDSIIQAIARFSELGAYWDDGGHSFRSDTIKTGSPQTNLGKLTNKKSILEICTGILGILLPLVAVLLFYANRKTRQKEDSQKHEIELDRNDKELIISYGRIEPLFYKIQYGYDEISSVTTERIRHIANTLSKAMTELESQFENPVLKTNTEANELWHEFYTKLKKAYWLAEGYESPSEQAIWECTVEGIPKFSGYLHANWEANGNSFRTDKKTVGTGTGSSS